MCQFYFSILKNLFETKLLKIFKWWWTNWSNKSWLLNRDWGRRRKWWLGHCLKAENCHVYILFYILLLTVFSQNFSLLKRINVTYLFCSDFYLFICGYCICTLFELVFSKNRRYCIFHLNLQCIDSHDNDTVCDFLPFICLENLFLAFSCLLQFFTRFSFF